MKNKRMIDACHLLAMEHARSLIYNGLAAAAEATGALIALFTSVVTVVAIVRVLYLHQFARRADALLRRI
jgi:hypothetical protein